MAVLSRDQRCLAQDGGVRRTVPFIAAWFAAGVAAVLLASAGVAMVSRQVTGSRPAPLSADEVREELADEEGNPPTTAEGATTTTTTTSPTSPTSLTSPTSPSSTPGTSGPGTTGGSPVSTVPPVTTTPPPTDGTTTTTPPPTAINRTYDLVGGTTTLRFTSAGVTVLTAVPAAGFSVEIDDDTHGNGVRVEFESDDHRSRVDAWWEGGPRDEVREDD
jgi:hypothetical protein